MSKQRLFEAGKNLLSLVHWGNRLTFWCGAIVVGIVAAGFAFVADFAQKGFGGIVTINPYLPLIVSPALFALAAWLTSIFSPGAIGSGIPQAIAARLSHNIKEQHYLLGPQIIWGKILFTALGMLGGASIGREGPTVQVGAAILYLGALSAGMSAEMSRTVILAGAAAGVAAAFNTPLAGIVFVIEEMARAFAHRHSGVVLTAIVLAGVSSLSILGDYTYFGHADGGFALSRDWLAIIVLGVLGGLSGGLFARLLSKSGYWLGLLRRKIRFTHPAVFAALCGLIIAGIGIATHGQTYGSGYEYGKAMLHGEIGGSWSFTIGKFAATLISAISGLPGGVFSPSLSVGAGLGATIASWFPHTPVAGIILLGMVGYFAGVTQAPITAFVVVLEISGKQSMPVPLIAVSVIAASTSHLICPVSLYHALAKNFIVTDLRQYHKKNKPSPEEVGSEGLD